ncbi:MAG: PAC2 family protein, partial [Thermoplasmata archaeon]
KSQLGRMKVTLSKHGKIEDPWLVAALPDMGNVAGLVVGHLNQQLETQPIGEILSYPSQITYRKGVLTEARPYSFRASHKDRVVTFTGTDHPAYPAELHELCEGVVDVAVKLGARRIFSVGASFRGQVEELPAVYGVVNRPELLEELKRAGVAALTGEGAITGFNGLILGVAKERGIDGICLLGDIDDPIVPQPQTARAVLGMLRKLTGIDMDADRLEEQLETLKRPMDARLQRFGFRPGEGRPPGIA